MVRRSEKTESSFQRVLCDECGNETGPFYIDTDDNEILCQDCVMNLPSMERLEFDRALESSVNWQLYRLPTSGKVTLECVHCRENHPDLGYGYDDNDDFLIEMTDILEKDEEHACYPCVRCGDGTNGEKEIGGDYYCDRCYEEAIAEDEEG